jgi:hypothetical protein
MATSTTARPSITQAEFVELLTDPAGFLSPPQHMHRDLVLLTTKFLRRVEKGEAQTDTERAKTRPSLCGEPAPRHRNVPLVVATSATRAPQDTRAPRLGQSQGAMAGTRGARQARQGPIGGDHDRPRCIKRTLEMREARGRLETPPSVPPIQALRSMPYGQDVHGHRDMMCNHFIY